MATVIVTEYENVYGLFYKPVNRPAKLFASVIGSSIIPADRIPYIEALGHTIELDKREVIPFPKRP